jgi:hypothetical protein
LFSASCPQFSIAGPHGIGLEIKGGSSMEDNSFGVLSLFLVFMAMAIAVGTVFPTAPLMAVLYIVIALFGFVLVLVSYCAKCPCRENGCGHVLPGKLAKFLPKRKEGPYSLTDYTFTAIGAAAILLIPQLWLIRNIPALLLFWGCAVVAALISYLLVCPDCPNEYCYLCGNREKARK